MARRRYFNYGAFRKYGFRSSAKYFYARGRKSGFNNKLMMFGGGMAAGYLAPDVVPYQNEAALVLACAPVRLPRNIRQAASGYVFGRMIRNITQKGIGTGTGGNSPWI